MENTPIDNHKEDDKVAMMSFKDVFLFHLK